MNHLLNKIESDPKLNSKKFLNLIQFINNKYEEDSNKLNAKLENSQKELEAIKLNYLKNRIIIDCLKDFSFSIGLENNKLMSEFPLNKYHSYELDVELNTIKLNQMERFKNDSIKDQSLMGLPLPMKAKPMSLDHQNLFFKFCMNNLSSLIGDLAQLSPNSIYLINQPVITQLNDISKEIQAQTQTIIENEELSQSLISEYNIKLEHYFEIIQIQLKKLSEIIIKLNINLKLPNINLIDNYFGLILTNANLKFCVLKSEFLLSTYQPEIIEKLTNIKDKLNNQESHLISKLKELQFKLNQYEELGPLFQTLTDEYSQVLNKIKIIENDINRLQE